MSYKSHVKFVKELQISNIWRERSCKFQNFPRKELQNSCKLVNFSFFYNFSSGQSQNYRFVKLLTSLRERGTLYRHITPAYHRNLHVKRSYNTRKGAAITTFSHILQHERSCNSTPQLLILLYNAGLVNFSFFYNFTYCAKLIQAGKFSLYLLFIYKW